MSQSFHLFQLQKVDSLIDQSEARINEINALLQQDSRLQAANTLLVEKQEILKRSQSQLKKIEFEVASKRAKLEQSEENLYSGRIRVPKELQDLQNEVASLKRIISSLEDQQLEAMLQVEADQAESEQALTAFHNVEGKVSMDQAALRGEMQSITTGTERLAIERKLLVQQISDSTMLLYEKLRKSRRGIAVAEVTDESCSACGAFITPADRQVARSPHGIFFCPSCGRVIYGG